MVALGNANGRMKDFTMSGSLEPSRLQCGCSLKAIDATFEIGHARSADEVGRLPRLWRRTCSMERLRQEDRRDELIDVFGKVVDDVKIFAMPRCTRVRGETFSGAGMGCGVKAIAVKKLLKKSATIGV
jgi:hypothetical protein